ncbi:MAG: 3-oxochol-4-en-24-oyl-CoA dehydrogenase [Pseudonocardiales bacterium]|nr:3-oxochol-4-en-24-oyl-CoA dehydrogenase [Pseudonocardiales bacterium]
MLAGVSGPITSSLDDSRELRDAVRTAATRTRPIAAVRDGDPAAARACWAALAEVGVFGAALPVDVGGAGGTVSDVAAALEQAASALFPGPVLPTVLAGLLMARCPDAAVTKELLPEVAEGGVALAVALEHGTLRARSGPGGVVVTGEVAAVLGAGDRAGGVLLGARCADGGELWFVLDTGHPGLLVTGRPSVDLSRAVARVALRDVVVPPGRVLPDLTTSAVRDLAVTLAAAEATGVAGWCLRAATDHARVREQFGRPIGSFQAVKHLCVAMLSRTEQAAALSWDAARAAEQAPTEFPLVAAAAAALALDAAVDTAKDAIQVLGGIGFTWDHDAHLYLRRALALRQLLGPTGGWRTRAATLALAGARRTLRVPLEPRVEAGRGELRALLAEVAALPAERQRARLAETGLLAPHWPAPYGQDAAPARQLLIDEELHRAEVRRPDLVIGAWAVPTLLRHGTPAQVERFAAPTLRGELTWCQLFSEPEAGSDLAALRTRAERVDGGWRLTGQKVWTSLARQADWAICLARTDPDVPRHRGISYFLVDMRSPGIEVRPLREITGDALFNEVFLDGVLVPDDCVVGEVGGGWALARTTLANERVAMGGGSSLGAAVERLLAAAPGPDERLGALIAEGLSVSLLDLRATLRALDGRDPGAESSVRKLIGVRHRQDVAEAALELAGPEGAADDGDSAALVHEFLLSRCHSIAGGTTQILSTLVGERILRLPREPA